MKNTEVKRLVYKGDFAFNEGIKVGKKETIEKAVEWLMLYGCEYATEEVMVEHFRKAMEE